MTRQLDRVEQAIERSGLPGLATVTNDAGRVQYIARVVGGHTFGGHRNDRAYLRDAPSRLTLAQMCEDIREELA